MYPELRIMLNKDFDKKICLEFLNTEIAGVNFGDGIIKTHPQLSVINNLDIISAQKIIDQYFDQFYLKNSQQIEETIKTTISDWDKIKKSFFEACDKYFDNHPWPKGKYEAYLSIINCNPRFLEDKTFQFYWKYNEGTLNVIFHEMLHFLFFDLSTTIFSKTNIKSQKIWELSEVFNGLIMFEPEFIKITGNNKVEQYPNLINLQKQMDKVWKENKSAINFIRNML